MKLIVSDEIKRKFTDLRIAILVASNIDNRGIDENLQSLKRIAADKMFTDYSYERLNELNEIEAWRNAYRAFGVKPKDSRPTAEAFLRRLIKGETFPTISKAVDSYLLVETEYYLPVGGYDLSKISGDVHLRFSDGDERFQPIGSSAEEATRPGEVIYADDERVLTRKWNFRDCDFCKVTDSSTSIALFTEAPSADIDTLILEKSIARMAELITTFCGGTARTFMLDTSESLSIDIH
ncbi:phenylalanine--tRNA ligase beta subunit-related protein [Nocardia sp. NBC_01377]|uniref:B3/B4 domain-containing protein n=1 Tax=Nocardia sp. NBC_01377 TaxID=2903595 RepID=UPI00324C22E8